MARYKPYDVEQGKFIPISFRDQILPGSFAYALDEIVEQHLDLTPCEARYTNKWGLALLSGQSWDEHRGLS